MRKSKRALLLGATVLAVTVLPAMLYARDSDGPSGSMMGGGMMGGGHTMGTSRMMGHCGDMMRDDRGSGRPNDQWRDGQSPAPDHHN